jgi:hypothetical protein
MRRFSVLSLVLPVLAVLAVPAVASTWGGLPRTGSYRGSVRRGGRVSFRVTRSGSRAGRWSMRIGYRCKNSSGQRIPGGSFVLRHKRNANVDSYGDMYPGFLARVTIHGVAGHPQFQVSGSFLTHHPVPPGPTSGQGQVEGFPIMRKDGAVCHIGPDDTSRWTARRR